MNRPIKFRAYDKEDEEMVDVVAINFADKQIKVNHWEYGESIWLPMDRFNIVQSTGLKDKNGVEIFEGDIVEIVQPERSTTINRNTGELWESKWENKTRSIVKWQDGNNPRWAGMFVWDKGTLEVIGNTFENPITEGNIKIVKEE